MQINSNIPVFNVGVNNDNSYLILSQKTALIECTSLENSAKHIENIKSILNEKKLDYIILNHTSPHNTGSIKTVIDNYPDAIIVASAAGIKNLYEQLNHDFPYMIAKDNLTLSIGIELKFFNLPNLPWTDTMATYCNGLLFCGSIFCDEPQYYQTYIKPYQLYAQTAAKRLASIEISQILPLKGAAINDIDSCITQYFDQTQKSEYINIFFSSFFGSTAKIAHTIYDILINSGLKAKLFNIDTENTSELYHAINNCKAFVLGTNTINRNAPCCVWDLIANIDLINNKYKPCFIFGSCGWSGEGVYLIEKHLKNLKMNIYDKPYVVNFNMSETEKEDLITHTNKFIKFINKEEYRKD